MVLVYSVVFAFIIFMGIPYAFKISEMLILSMELNALEKSSHIIHGSGLCSLTPSIILLTARIWLVVDLFDLNNIDFDVKVCLF